ncbi:hypothetical protein K8I28_15050 [bacterium]|nr:hypothetical protein [bacterium]
MDTPTPRHGVLLLLKFLISPKQTIARLLEIDPHFGVVWLGILEGITAALRSSVIHGLHPLPDFVGINSFIDKIIHFGLGESPSLAITIFAIVAYGSLLGTTLVLLGSLLVRITGIFVGGRVRHRGHRTAIAWSFLPYLIALPVWAVFATLNYSSLRLQSFPYGSAYPWELFSPLNLLLLFDYLLRIVSVFYLVRTISTVQKLTTWRSCAAIALAFIPFFTLLALSQKFGF